MTAEVTVVVPTFERAELLPRLIAALECQTVPRECFEVVVFFGLFRGWGDLF